MRLRTEHADFELVSSEDFNDETRPLLRTYHRYRVDSEYDSETGRWWAYDEVIETSDVEQSIEYFLEEQLNQLHPKGHEISIEQNGVSLVTSFDAQRHGVVEDNAARNWAFQRAIEKLNFKEI